jgi:hypothetical protein
MRQRWTRVGLLALAIVVINVVSRFVTWKFDLVSEDQQSALGFVAIIIVAVVLVGATAWWSIRFPFTRAFADLGVATIVGALLSLILGPFAGGAKPFAEGLGLFVGEFLMFLGIAAVGAVLGFLAVVALGKDWKSRGLRRYEERYSKRPHRSVRG